MTSILDTDDVEELDLIARTKKNHAERSLLNKKLREYDNNLKHSIPNHLRPAFDRTTKSQVYGAWQYRDVEI
jgi:hypothetical protein